MVFTGRWRSVFALATAAVLLSIAFQNCGQFQGNPIVAGINQSSESSDGTSTPSPAQPTPDSTAPPGSSPTATPAPSPTPTATPPPPPPPPTATPAGTPGVRYFGRFDLRDRNAAKFSWSGSSIVARFTGTAISAKLNSNRHYFVSVVDGGTPRRFVVGNPGTYTLATNLSSGVHEVLLFRDSEGFYGTSQFMGFDITGGELLAPDESIAPVRSWGTTDPPPANHPSMPWEWLYTFTPASSPHTILSNEGRSHAPLCKSNRS